MKKQDAFKIKNLVDNRSSLESLDYYVNLRIQTLKDSLVHVVTIDELRRIQGAIEELKRFNTLRDEVNNPRD